MSNRVGESGREWERMQPDHAEELFRFTVLREAQRPPSGLEDAIVVSSPGSFVYGVEPTKPIDLVELAQQLDTLIENRSNLILRLSDAPELVRRLDS